MGDDSGDDLESGLSMTGRQSSNSSRKPASPKPVTRSWLDNATRYYLERYASSSDNLRHVLMRKARKRIGVGATLDTDHLALIDETVARAVSCGLVDDRRYAEGRVASLMRKGTSRGAARAKLRAKGVGEEEIARAMAQAAPDDTALARRFAERKRLGPWRRGPADAEILRKELAAMARAGFSYSVASNVLKAELDDAQAQALAQP